MGAGGLLQNTLGSSVSPSLVLVLREAVVSSQLGNGPYCIIT